ncbi:MAG: FAD-binding domain-containing protein [Phycisphaerales bacterium]|nr:FAD-binding domain-containing protein [Phycisphaerales bacterium]
MFISKWIPELDSLDDRLVHESWASPLAAASVDYPPPIVDQKKGRQRALEVFEAARVKA